MSVLKTLHMYVYSEDPLLRPGRSGCRVLQVRVRMVGINRSEGKTKKVIYRIGFSRQV